MSLVSVKSPEAPIHDDVRSFFSPFSTTFVLASFSVINAGLMVWFEGSLSKRIGRRISLK